MEAEGGGEVQDREGGESPEHQGVVGVLSDASRFPRCDYGCDCGCFPEVR